MAQKPSPVSCRSNLLEKIAEMQKDLTDHARDTGLIGPNEHLSVQLRAGPEERVPSLALPNTFPPIVRSGPIIYNGGDPNLTKAQWAELAKIEWAMQSPRIIIDRLQKNGNEIRLQRLQKLKACKNENLHGITKVMNARLKRLGLLFRMGVAYPGVDLYKSRLDKAYRMFRIPS